MAPQFIHGHKPAPHCLVHPQGQLFYWGRCNMDWNAVADTLATGQFPQRIRGEFAFIWQTENETMAAVDHVATYPLFYSAEKISNVFCNVLSSLKSRQPNLRVEHQIQFLGGHSLGSETTDRAIQRLLPGHFLKEGRLHRYIDLLDYMGDEQLHTGEFSALVESTIEQLIGAKNTLLFSGGTDSTALAGIVKKIGRVADFKFVHVYSALQSQSELNIIAQTSTEMGLQIETARVDMSGDILPEISDRQFSFWIENPFPAKRRAVELLGLQDNHLFTGELGDQLFGGPKNSSLINYALQTPQIDVRVVATLWLNQSATYGRNSSRNLCGKIEDYLNDYPESRPVLEELLQQIGEIFQKIPTPDFLHRLMLMNYVIKGPYRTWAYSQDTLHWVHPFASWRLFDLTFRTSSKAKIYNGGISKSILLDTWRDHLSPLPWSLPKHGLGVPTKSKLCTPP
jgi:asparagine synthetase B (glutamine-hydrolysing)